MNDLFINIITHPAISFVACLIGFLVGNRFALGRDQRKEFNAAAITFRSAFVNEIRLLRENIVTGNKIPSNIIQPGILINHEKAKIVFEPFVSVARRSAFNDAWDNYKNSENIYCQQVPMENMGLNKFKKDLSNVYLVHINKLLDGFAKLK